MKKKILVFSQNYRPSSLADAIRIGPVIDYLIGEKHSVHLLTQTRGVLIDDTFSVQPLTLFSPTNGDGNIVRLLKEIGLGLEIFFRVLCVRKFDYYYFTSPPFISCAIGIFAAFIKGGKVIFDVRDIYPEIYVKQQLIKHNGTIHKALVKLERYIYSRSYIILAATEGLQKAIKQSTSTRCLLFRNGFSTKFLPCVEKMDSFTVVFHGNLGRFQNIEMLTEILQNTRIKNSDITFVVIGSGPKENLLKGKDFQNLKFYGRLSNTETSEIVNKCHVGLSLRDDSQISIDAFPVKIYEYIGSGIPTIATPICEGGKVLTDLNIGFNTHNDLNIIIDLIFSLRNDKDLYSSLVHNMLSIRVEFSREQIVKSVFREII